MYIVHLAYLLTTQATLMWQCPQIHGFWGKVVKFLRNIMGSPIPLTLQCCVLGILEIPDLARAQQTILHETLFQARRLIARKWMNDHTPSLSEWMHSVNASLPDNITSFP